MESLSNIIADIKNTIEIPKGKHLEIVISIIGASYVDAVKYFPDEDKELIEEIKNDHVIILNNNAYSVRICDDFYFVSNLEDFYSIYKSKSIKVELYNSNNHKINTTYRVSYRIIDSIDYNPELVASKNNNEE